LQAGQLELLLSQHLLNMLHKALQSTICGGRLEVTPISSIAVEILSRKGGEVNEIFEMVSCAGVSRSNLAQQV
jgi:hypothetical protein